ncbi:MAG: ATP-dependent DNA helicase DinG [Gammaproteobacteria bacterium]|nr:MAG: ATP-dependent DNA helicase DinG [Gammaproteobacteria bacterium]
MLSDELKLEIQTAYSTYLKSNELTARPGQKRMIAAIANALAQVQADESGARTSGEPVCLVEAPTGTGKTVAYILAALPVAIAQGKKIIISTATVNLQEQIVYRDLPNILRSANLAFSYALAKGRGRYLCVSKLRTLCGMLEESGRQSSIDFLLSGNHSIESDERTLYKELQDSFDAKDWDGDRDNWADTLDGKSWHRVTASHFDCSGRRCPHIDECPYFNARKELEEVQCVVANHDLVLADVALGGGTILPAPEESIYIFDEAHHLPEKALNHFSLSFRTHNSQQWLQQIDQQLTQIGKICSGEAMIADQLKKIPGLIEQISAEMSVVTHMIEPLLSEAPSFKSNSDPLYRFENGDVPEPLMQHSANFSLLFVRLNRAVMVIADEFKEIIEVGRGAITKADAEIWHPVFAQHVARSESAYQLWEAYSKAEESQAPNAKWIELFNFDNQDEFEINCSPVFPGDILDQFVWQRCYGAVLTSATLAPMGTFDRFVMRSGVPSGSHREIVPSLFNYSHQAVLNVPKLNCDPTDSSQHNELVVHFVKNCLKEDEACLVVFTAKKQMHDVYESLPVFVKDRILIQGGHSKQEILNLHRERIDLGRGSIIFGLASFSEGVDLPGKYLSHVVIARIPFAVPDNPVVAATYEWLEKQGKNPFAEVSIPDATLKLIQTCGRLIRREDDCGQITVLDRRLMTRRYGSTMIKALPPYRLNMGQPLSPDLDAI